MRSTMMERTELESAHGLTIHTYGPASLEGVGEEVEEQREEAFVLWERVRAKVARLSEATIEANLLEWQLSTGPIRAFVRALDSSEPTRLVLTLIGEAALAAELDDRGAVLVDGPLCEVVGADESIDHAIRRWLDRLSVQDAVVVVTVEDGDGTGFEPRRALEP